MHRIICPYSPWTKSPKMCEPPPEGLDTASSDSTGGPQSRPSALPGGGEWGNLSATARRKQTLSDDDDSELAMIHKEVAILEKTTGGGWRAARDVTHRGRAYGHQESQHTQMNSNGSPCRFRSSSSLLCCEFRLITTSGGIRSPEWLNILNQ